MFYPEWQEKVTYSDDGPEPAVLMEDDRLKVVLAGLKPGQKIPPHPEAQAVYHILEGSGWMVVDDERLRVKAGSTVITPAGALRGVEAGTRLAFLATRIG